MDTHLTRVHIAAIRAELRGSHHAREGVGALSISNHVQRNLLQGGRQRAAKLLGAPAGGNNRSILKGRPVQGVSGCRNGGNITHFV